MSTNLEELRKKWVEERETYEELAKTIADCLTSLLERHNVVPRITYRAKETASLLKKSLWKSVGYEDITDKAGVRVVVKFEDQVETVNKVIESSFECWSKENKGDSLEYNQVGYQAFHYEILLPEDILHERERLRGKICEVQVKTLCQNVWAELCHSLAYKHEFRIPKDIHRRIYGLSALFEVADREAMAVKEDILSLPATTTYAVVAHLEALFFEFIAVEYDRELTREVVDHLSLLVSQDEKEKFPVMMREFAAEHRERLGRLFEMYRENRDRHLLLFQPECLLIFWLIETRRHDLLAGIRKLLTTSAEITEAAWFNSKRF
jgi:ppGpp synthetase/RelA/SpoT-type nucleotidyltranferase